MAREIIDAIRQAETEAAAWSASAAKEAERILKEAEEQAAALKKEMTKKALDEAEAVREAAEQECAVMLSEAEKQEKEEGIRLEALLTDKRREAVKAVLAELV